MQHSEKHRGQLNWTSTKMQYLFIYLFTTYSVHQHQWPSLQTGNTYSDVYNIMQIRYI